APNAGSMLMRKPPSSTAAPPYSAPAAVYAHATCVRTRRPAIHAALGFAPTAWKRRPAAVKRRRHAIASVRPAPVQKTALIPNGFCPAHDVSASGTASEFVFDWP